MDRVRTILYELSLIFLIGVSLGCLGVWAYTTVKEPSIEDFQREYAIGDVWHQQAVAEKYLQHYPAAVLLQAIEDAHAAGNCHSQGHGIGRALYKADPNFASVIRQCGGTCTYGCFHGAMMEMFQTESDTLGGAIEDETPEAYAKHLQAAARTLCDLPEVKSSVHPRYCTHGLGHTFAYFSPDDMDQAIRSCGTLSSAYGAKSCASGAFMEYLFSSSSAALMSGKGQAPCDRYPQYTQACYMFKAYGWLYAWGSVASALAACDTFGGNTQLCIVTTAQAASNKDLVRSRAGVESICGSLSGEKRKTCVYGALLKIIDLNNGDDSDALCDSVDPIYRNACLEILHSFLENIAHG
jgi:hypothetical protein